MDLHDEDRGLVPTLRAGGLTLRPLSADDCEAVVAALNHWPVTRWLTMVPFPYDAADYDWFLNTFVPQQDHTVWAIDAGDGLIGCVGIRPELGYWLAPDHHGQGVMTAAATLAVDWYFARWWADLTSGYHLGNGPSARVLAKLGFRDTHIRDDTTARQEQVRIQRMSLKRADWLAQHG